MPREEGGRALLLVVAPDMPPDFSDVEYWNARFITEDGPFEWLKEPSDVLPHLQSIVSKIPEASQKILHIGSGSSTLSLSLRNLVCSPDRVHNVDYSQHAIDLGLNMERKAFGNTSDNFMNWSCLNLLDRNDVHTLMLDDVFEPRVTLIVDKSATDSIACGPDVVLNPDAFQTRTANTSPKVERHDTMNEKFSVHPVTLLALHMATLTPPGACWLCLSYSSERFPFWSHHGTDNHTEGYPQPSMFWTLESLEPVPAKIEYSPTRDGHVHVHRPQVDHWLYVLRRTDEDLDLRRGTL